MSNAAAHGQAAGGRVQGHLERHADAIAEVLQTAQFGLHIHGLAAQAAVAPQPQNLPVRRRRGGGIQGNGIQGDIPVEARIGIADHTAVDPQRRNLRARPGREAERGRSGPGWHLAVQAGFSPEAPIIAAVRATIEAQAGPDQDEPARLDGAVQ